MWGLGAIQRPCSDQGRNRSSPTVPPPDDKHLRSSQAVTGYQIEATDEPSAV